MRYNPLLFAGKALAFGLFFLCVLLPSGLSQPTLKDSIALEAFFDGLMAGHMKTEHIAGATVSVVRGGKLVFAKGYGYADLDARKKVQPDQTLFRIGSISKMFTWTAVMQLVREGKIDLDADINTYLKDFKIPDTYDQPITMKHLMTHSAGFEDKVIGLFAKSADRLRPLGDILKDELPARIQPPGETSSYSNHGTGIAAYIVEQLSGMDFNEYVEKKILQPLGMSHTTFRQPLPAGLAGDMSKGYKYEGGELKEKDFEFVPLFPVGAASSTATDIARFMLMNLQSGTLDSITVLDSTTMVLMQSPAFRHAPEVNPMRYGFIDGSMKGRKIIGHGGDTFWFHSMMVLMPDYNTGLFISVNSEGGGGTPTEVLEAFIDEFFPAGDPPALEAASADEAGKLDRFTGSYRANRYPHKDITRIAALMGAIKISVTEDGQLQTTDGSGEVQRWVQTGPLSFREEHDWGTLVFRENEKQEITHGFIGELPIIAMERIPSLDSPDLTMGLLALSFVLFLAALIGWPVGARLRRHYRVGKREANLLPAEARTTGWLAALAFVGYVLGFSLVFSDPLEIVFGVPAGLRLVQVIPLIGLLLSVGVFYYTFKIWQHGSGRVSARLFYSTLALACVVTLFFMNQWNLLGFKF